MRMNAHYEISTNKQNDINSETNTYLSLSFILYQNPQKTHSVPLLATWSLLKWMVTILTLSLNSRSPFSKYLIVRLIGATPFMKGIFTCVWYFTYPLIKREKHG